MGDARIQVPAVIIEPRGIGDALDVIEVLVLELPESNDDVGDLDACVVDVVLHFDRDASESLHAHQRIAERGIAKVANMRRLVRVNRSVLDNRFLGSDPRTCTGTGVRPQWHDSFNEGDSIQIDIQIPVRRGFDTRYALDRTEAGCEL